MDTAKLIQAIRKTQNVVGKNRAALIGISGIDASGKGYITAKLANALQNYNVAVVNADGWLNLPNVRFDEKQPAENFYENALRLDEMFERLILPLKRDRNIELTMDLAEETATEFRLHTYSFNNIDIILLEGIFIFKKKYRDLFDLKIWIDCSFQTALERAIARSQEGLSPEQTIRAYETIYFPAQQIHFATDSAKQHADLIVSITRGSGFVF